MKINIFLITLILSTVAIAKKNYITSPQSVTFRSGPSVDNKIIKMIPSEDAVEVIEIGDEWSKVSDSSGTEGYVLNRFLTSEIPYSLRFKWLKSQMDKLKTESDDLSEKNKKLANNVEELKKIEQEYIDLKAGSAEYLALKQKHENLIEASSKFENKISHLESRVTTIYIYWFLAGAGVFLLGWIVGIIGRKKRSQSSIRL